MRSDRNNRASFGLKLAAGLGLAFLHLPILLIFVYAFTTEEKSYQWPPPGFTLQWFEVTWNRQMQEGETQSGSKLQSEGSAVVTIRTHRKPPVSWRSTNKWP